MAFELEILIIDAGDGTIKVGHHFYGYTEEECRTYFREHMACGYLSAAVREDRIIETLEEIDDDELPEAEEDEEEE